MKKILISVLAISLIGFLVYMALEMYNFGEGVLEDSARVEQINLKHKLQDGDIIFQTSRSSQSKAIQLATDSRYSHMGIIYEKQGQYFVYEAIQPVKLTPLEEWTKRGENGQYVVKRLKNGDEVLTAVALDRMKKIGERFMGKDYDLYFEWTDEKIYCSELVWKMYEEATGIQIGELERLSDFDLSSHTVRKKMKERYGNNIPLEEKVISPAAMFNSDLLLTVVEK